MSKVNELSYGDFFDFMVNYMFPKDVLTCKFQMRVECKVTDAVSINIQLDRKFWKYWRNYNLINDTNKSIWSFERFVDALNWYDGGERYIRYFYFEDFFMRDGGFFLYIFNDYQYIIDKQSLAWRKYMKNKFGKLYVNEYEQFVNEVIEEIRKNAPDFHGKVFSDNEIAKRIEELEKTVLILRNE